jgi:hypothetical protein
METPTDLVSAQAASRLLDAMEAFDWPGLEAQLTRPEPEVGSELASEAQERLELLDAVTAEVRRALAGRATPDRGETLEVCVELLRHLAQPPHAWVHDRASRNRRPGGVRWIG